MIELMNNVSLIPEASAILAISEPLFSNDEFPKILGNLKIAPWGSDNNAPKNIIDKVDKSEVVGSNLLFNTQSAYGMGPKPYKRILENGKVKEYQELFEGQEAEFFEDNDVGLYFLEQLNDMNYFWNTFPEIVLNEQRNKIVSLQSKEAAFSRWTKADAKGSVKHVYSTKWPSPRAGEYTVTEVLNEFNPYSDLIIRSSKDSNFIYPVYMPSPGRPYYSNAPWWSIFNSGYYDHSVSVPQLKNAILKNKLGIKFIIYVSDKYFSNIFEKEGIDSNNKEATRARIEQEKANFTNFLTGSAGVAKSLMALKRTLQTATGSKEEKDIEIEEIKNDLSGGELIPDMEEVNNVICYAMGVHPSLVGAVPGKNKGGFSGSDKRELFLIKQALTRPLVDRILRPFNLIKRFNKWDKNTVIMVPEYVFTTLDKNKSGKEEVIV